MKILILAPYSSVHTKKWVGALVEQGMKVKVLTLHSDDSEKMSDFDVCVLPAYLRSLPKPFKFFLFSFWAKWKNSSFKADKVHAYFASSYGLSASLLFKNYIVSVWGSDVLLAKQGWLKLKLITKVLNSSQAVCVTSKFLQAELCKLGVENSLIHLTPFGVETDIFSYTLPQSSPKPFSIGCTKSLSEVYGTQFLLEVFLTLVKKHSDEYDFRLFLTGDVRKGCPYKKFVSHNFLKEKVIFLGQVEHSRMPELYKKLDLLVFPSNFESFGVSVLEAMSTGVPVISSSVGGLKELVEDGESGFIIERFIVDDYVDKIYKLASSQNLRSRFSVNGRRFVEENYSWKDSVDKMMAVYSSFKSSSE